MSRICIFTVQRRCSSTAVQSRKAFVSRRAWQTFRAENPRVSPKESKPIEEEKPWPRNVVLTGYAVASIFIPYSIAWFLSMNGEARRFVARIVPGLEPSLREFFGHEEYTPYQELRDGVKPRKQLDDEECFDVRVQQELIEELNNTETFLYVHMFKDGGTVTIDKVLPGATLAEADAVVSDRGGSIVSFDFNDVTTKNSTEISDQLLEEAPELHDSQGVNPIYSSWYHQPPTNPQERAKAQETTRQDIEILRLEHTIQELQAAIVDVNSTRDIDDMHDELARCKSELRSLRWKRRLGMS